MPLFTAKPHKLHPVAPGASIAFRLYLMFGPDELGPAVSGTPALICIYDLDLYLESQRKPGQVGFAETDDTRFTGQRTELPELPKRHVVEPGTGVLFIGDVQFKRLDQPKNGHRWFINRIVARKELTGRVCDISIRAHARVDERGNPDENRPFALQEIGLFSYAQSDFEKILSGKREQTRKIAVRVLNGNGKQVLLSSFNMAHVTNKTDKAVIPHLAICSRQPVPKVKEEGKAAGTAQAIAKRLILPDPTGFYVADVEGAQVTPPTKAKEPRGERLSAPAALWLQAAGQSLVGWYYPVRDELLNNRALFPADIRSKMLSTQRICFIAGEGLSDLRVPNTEAIPEKARRIYFIESADELDPTELLGVELAENRALGIVGQGWIRLEGQKVDSKTFEVTGPSVELGLPTGRIGKFEFAYRQTRVPWAVVHQLLQDNITTNTELQALITDFIEPVTPGTRVVILDSGFDRLIELVQAYVRARGGTTGNVADPALLRAELDISRHLEGLHATYPSAQADSLVAQFQVEAQNRLIRFPDRLRSVWEVLQEIVAAKIERQIDAMRRDNPDESPDLDAAHRRAVRDNADARGYSLFHVTSDKRRFRYRVQFTPAGLSGGAFAKGSAGGFKATIIKTEVTVEDGKLKEDPSPTFRQLEPQSKEPADRADFFGFFIGCGAGVIIGFDISAGKQGEAPGSGAPIDCVLETPVSLTVDQFHGARFNTFSQIRPGASINSPAFSGSLGTPDTIFDIKLNRVPALSLSAAVDGEFLKPNASTPGISEAMDRAKEIAEELRKGDQADPKKIKTISVNAVLYGLTLCWGIMVNFGDRPQIILPPKTIKEIDQMRPKDLNVQTTLVAFRKAQVDLEPAGLKHLETVLATYRKLLELEGWMRIEGQASPEFSVGTREQARPVNDGFSRQRAESVMQALIAAVGGPGGTVIPQNKEIEVIGSGAEPFKPLFTSGELRDPFAAVSAAEKAAILRDSETVYRDMRRVLLSATGVFFLKLPAE